ncbi:tetratricopeptide repeat protein [Gelidibacter maritimus]|uniref:Tetratricopeptide repeat protein n=1 Tax=Gelidibacter maritimus TaxID=2761487 RepID=A0A7W2M2X4_9FLAO|nr:tetratricopeptide repeat protein [Gelidibacter maritimus]MBA6151685.1 tetratricopeptide repeat protein [Gelidibacter maritimus]
MQEQDFILFDDYLSGSLDTESIQAFENRLNTDPDFKLAFIDYQQAEAFLEHKFKNEEQTQHFKENLERISSGYFEKKASGKTKVLRIKPWYYSVAAGVILLFGVVIAQQFSSPTYDDFANYGTISLTVRGSDNALQNQAEKAFNNKDYKDAEQHLSQLLQKDPNNLELQLYKAISLVELNRYDEADKLYQNVIQSPSVYSTKAKWYLALSKLKQKDESASIAVLKTIPEDADDFQSAQKLLRKLQ